MKDTYLEFYEQQLDEYVKHLQSPIDAITIDSLVSMREEAESYVSTLLMYDSARGTGYQNRIEEAYKQGLELLKQKYNI